MNYKELNDCNNLLVNGEENSLKEIHRKFNKAISEEGKSLKEIADTFDFLRIERVKPSEIKVEVKEEYGEIKRVTTFIANSSFLDVFLRYIYVKREFDKKERAPWGILCVRFEGMVFSSPILTDSNHKTYHKIHLYEKPNGKFIGVRACEKVDVEKEGDAKDVEVFRVLQNNLESPPLNGEFEVYTIRGLGATCWQRESY